MLKDKMEKGYSLSLISHSLSYLAYGKAVTLDGSPARLVLGATTKLN